MHCCAFSKWLLFWSDYFSIMSDCKRLCILWESSTSVYPAASVLNAPASIAESKQRAEKP